MVLAPLDPVVGAAPALVVGLLFVVVVEEEPAGGLAVELQPASTRIAAAGARAKVCTRIVV
ncbi:hypothetical protein MOTT27_04250 [Mycobacterium intracellulare subsp. yongonense]|nr:hypothetical protein MOTT27_04250 [Mycobacterium intracellulare subsp. yongonense]